MASVTIRDVARRAGVSTATVSQALSGNRPVSRETKERIDLAIRELGYVPSYTASHLKSGQSGLLGCYVADITEDFTAYMLKGIEKAIRDTGYSLVFGSGVDIGTSNAEIGSYFRKYNVDGLFAISHLSATSVVAPAENETGIPTVFVNTQNPYYDSVIPDNATAGELVAQHMYDCGVRRPLFLGGPRNRISVTNRLSGFLNRFAANNVPIAVDCVYFNDFTYESGYEMARNAFVDHPESDGVFCANDYIALGALKFFNEAGIRVPEQVKIVGFDNRDIAKYCSIPITTVDQNLVKVGEIAVERMLVLVRDGVNIPGVFHSKPQLIVRESCR